MAMALKQAIGFPSGSRQFALLVNYKQPLIFLVWRHITVTCTTSKQQQLETYRNSDITQQNLFSNCLLR